MTPRSHRRIIRAMRGSGIYALLAGTVWLLGPALAWSQTEEPTPEEAIANEGDAVSENIERRNSLQQRYEESTLGRWLAPWEKKRDEWFERIGLEMLLSYDALAQASLGGGQSPFAASGDLTLSGSWQLWGQKVNRPIELDFRVRHRHAYGGLSPSQLGDEIGALWGTVDGFSDAGFEIPDFFLKQRFQHRNVELRYGQLGVENQLDRHALRGAKRSFLNQAFSTNPAVPFPRFGAGGTLHWDPDNPFDFTAAITTVQASKTGDQIAWKLGSSDLFYGIQGGWDFAGWRNDPARSQLLIWFADGKKEADLEPGSGASLTIEQELKAAQARTFLRLAYSRGGSAAVEFLAAGGLGLSRRKADLLGLSFGVGRGAEPATHWQAVIEAFYRWQISPHGQITPDLQILVGEGLEGSGSIRVISGIRAQIAF